MKKQTTRMASLTIAALMTITVPAMPETKTIEIKIIETSDVHGHFFPYDFMENKPLKGTLARVNSYVQRQRQQYGKRLLLIDNGDILQGQPCSYWSNFVMPQDENLAASVINYMGYDAETVGNHDIELGHKVYDKWIREVRCPLLGANIVDRQTKAPYVKPYSIHYVDGVKIAVIGMLTPAIPHWLSEDIWKGLEFEEMVACARKWVKRIQTEEQPDLIFGLFHSGLDGGITTAEYEENATAAVAREVPGFDIIFFGHDHQIHNEQITSRDGAQVLCIDPSCYARNIAEATVRLTYRDGKLANKDIKGNIVSMDQETVDQDMINYFQGRIDQIRKYVEQPICTLEESIYTRDCFFGSSAFCDLIHNLQLKITGADISFNAPLSFNTEVKAGTITMGDMFKLYRFENLLYILNMTGREIKNHLEMSYDMWTNKMNSPDDHIMLLNDNAKEDQQRSGFKNYTFNFDSACGIDYEVDVTKPAGQKVRILRMSNGEPFDENRWYRVVTNSYRGNGGGELLTQGAGIPKDSLEARIVYKSERDQRHYLTEELKRMGKVSPKPNGNWRFIPEEWASSAIERDRRLIFGKEK